MSDFLSNKLQAQAAFLACAKRHGFAFDMETREKLADFLETAMREITADMNTPGIPAGQEGGSHETI